MKKNIVTPMFIVLIATILTIPSFSSFAQENEDAPIEERLLESYELEHAMVFREAFGLIASEEHILDVSKITTKNNSKKHLGVYLNDKEYTELLERFQLIDEAMKLGRDFFYGKFNNAFGGIYYDHKINALRIGIVEKSNIFEQFKNEILFELNNHTKIEFFEVKYTFEELIKKKEEIDNYLITNDIPFSLTDLSPSLNRVVVGFENQELIDKFKLILREDYIVYIIEKYEPVIETARTDYIRPLEAGLHLNVSSMGSSNTCTGGFSAKDSLNNYFYITAGHCGEIGDNISQGNQLIGPITKKKNADRVDAAAIPISSNDSSSKLYNFGHIGNVPDPTLVIVGAPICLSGAISGVICGEIVSANYSPPNLGDQIYNMIRANFKGVPGDSGGPGYWGNYNLASLYGIVKGNHLLNTVYSHTEYVLEDLGLWKAVTYGSP